MRPFTSYSLAIAGLAATECAALRVSAGNRTEHFSHLEHLFENPNATSFVTFKGPDVSQKYPGDGSVDWQVFMRLTGDVLPLKNSSSQDDRITVTDQGVTFSNDSSLLDLNATFQADDSWAMCVGWSLLVSSEDEYPLDQEVDPSCKGLVEDECLEWLEEVASNGTFCSTDFDGSEVWESTPCEGDERLFAESLGPWRSRKINGLPMNDMTWMTVFDDGEESRGEQRDGPSTALKSYDSMVQGISMVWVGFGHSDDLRGDREQRMRESDVKVPSTFRCIRRDKFSEGSRNAEDIQKSIEEDAGAGLRISMALAGVAGCVAMMMNML